MSNLILNVNGNKRPKGDNMKSLYSWHYRLSHTSERRMTKLHKYGSIGSFDCESSDTCKSCLLGKDDQVAHFNKKGECTNGTLDVIHKDICGPMYIHVRGGFIYFITFTNVYS